VNPEIRLVVEHDRFESRVWGTPQRDRVLEIPIWTNALSNGESVWEKIQKMWSPQDRSSGVITKL